MRLTALLTTAAMVLGLGCGRIGYDESSPVESCGDGIISAQDESCDDGNLAANDGCTQCTPDPGFVCSGEPSLCTICGTAIDSQTVAIYPFENVLASSLAPDLLGNQTGVFRNGPPVVIAGPPGCGDALQFPGTQTAPPPIPFVDVPDGPEWHLPEGAIDFWIQLHGTPAINDDQAILGRDAIFTPAPGHFLISRICNNHIAVRLQTETNPSGTTCSEVPIPNDTWVHLGINFGGGLPLELFINGQQHNGAQPAGCTSGGGCGIPVTIGIDGNRNPWAFGAGNFNSTEETNDDISDGLEGSLDHIRISRQRRAF